MPYIVIVNRPGFLPEADPYAVATLEEARTEALDKVWCCDMYNGVDPEPDLQACRDLPESGGTIGPLPDGYVIEVRPVSWAELSELAEWPVATGARADFGDAQRQEILIDAYNGER